MVDLILFPSDYFDGKKVDEELIGEYNGAKATGLFDTVIFNYDSWFNHDRLVLSKTPENKRRAVYRGWMMNPEKYEVLYKTLLENNIELITSPENYRLMHIFPNVYKYFEEDTAKMEIFPLHEHIDVEYLKSIFDRFIIKDYVKSVKGTEFPKFFDDTVTQEQFDQWMDVFYKYRGDLLTGGICVKEFLDLKFYNDKTNEYRVFYAGHDVISVCRNSGQDNDTSELPKELIDKYKNLNSIYYTVDFAELENGNWKVLEAGDGSVSGLPDIQDTEEYFKSLYHSLNNS